MEATLVAAAQQRCDRYAALIRLPDAFEEIASGDLVGAELFVLTDGVCTCDNTPAIDRWLGKRASAGINWSCRAATPDERRRD
jgi:hypothetical protein